MATENNPNTQKNQQANTFNPSIAKGADQKYNPKREANAQHRNETTGLDEDIAESDQGLGEENSSSASGSVRNDDSGAI